MYGDEPLRVRRLPSQPEHGVGAAGQVQLAVCVSQVNKVAAVCTWEIRQANTETALRTWQTRGKNRG